MTMGFLNPVRNILMNLTEVKSLMAPTFCSYLSSGMRN